MAKYVTRTFVTTVIHGVSVYMDGDNCVTSPPRLDVLNGRVQWVGYLCEHCLVALDGGGGP